ncbi:MAG TPA: transcription antitermination factor NusB [Vicinamibacterales bacterium]|nr:transcription antitermination factor NusB [Vicinamibacterales bacterium]
MKTARHQAREAALQALYFWEVGRAEPAEAIAATIREHHPDLDETQRAFAAALVRGTVSEVAALDAAIEPHLKNWRLDRLAVIDRLVVRMATWELRHEPETPAAIVIDEAIELARTFSGPAAVPFVNGVLDAIRRSIADPSESQ